MLVEVAEGAKEFNPRSSTNANFFYDRALAVLGTLGCLGFLLAEYVPQSLFNINVTDPEISDL